MTNSAKDLAKEAPTSPSDRVGGYVILGRLADKARAEFLGGNISDYHTDCPLDHMLLDWKGVPYADIKKEIVGGADDEALAKYLDSHGTKKTGEEVEAWSDSMDEASPYSNPKRRIGLRVSAQSSTWTLPAQLSSSGWKPRTRKSARINASLTPAVSSQASP